MTDKIVTAISPLLCGLGLGWLIGLSVTPVIQGVITALLTLVITLLTCLIGIRSASTKDTEGPATPAQRHLPAVQPLPLALFVLALAIGSSLGVVARTHQWLGAQTDPSVTAQDRKFLEPVLFTSLSPEECTRFKAAPDDQLERVMAQSHNPRVREFVRRCAGNRQCLRAAVEELLCAGKD